MLFERTYGKAYNDRRRKHGPEALSQPTDYPRTCSCMYMCVLCRVDTGKGYTHSTDCGSHAVGWYFLRVVTRAGHARVSGSV